MPSRVKCPKYLTKDMKPLFSSTVCCWNIAIPHWTNDPAIFQSPTVINFLNGFRKRPCLMKSKIRCSFDVPAELGLSRGMVPPRATSSSRSDAACSSNYAFFCSFESTPHHLEDDPILQPPSTPDNQTLSASPVLIAHAVVVAHVSPVAD